MTDKSDNNWIAYSDKAIMEIMGDFIKHQRLQQNKSQQQLAKEAGIARSTLSMVEKGENNHLLVFIQILRALNLLYLLQEFKVSQQISPLLLAKMEKSKRLRATSDKYKKLTHKSSK
jgi:transcriptional regulator with XRE-family HTH domain